MSVVLLAEIWDDGIGGWTQEQITGTTDWTITDAYSKTGDNSIRFLQSGSGHVTDLITPRIDMSNYADGELTFWMTNEAWAGDQDELDVYISVDNKASWIHLQNYNQSIPRTTFEQKTITLPVSADGAEHVFIRFRGTSNWGYGVYIDDIETTANVAGVIVSTNNADTLAHDSGKLHGELENIGEEYSVDVFFQYRKIDEGEWQETPKQTLTEIGMFDATVDGLYYDTDYEFRAVGEYDDNASTKTVYGAVLTFSTLTMTGYEIERKVGEGEWETHNLIDDGYEITWDDTDVSESITYHYRIRQVSPTNLSVWSDTKSITYGEETPAIPAPILTAITDTIAGSAKFNGEVTDMGGEASVQAYFEYRKVGDPSWTSTTPQTITELGTYDETVTGLDLGYTYEVRAVQDTNTDIGYSEIQTFETGYSNEATITYQDPDRVFIYRKKTIPIYGVRIDTTNDNPATAVSYTDDAEGFSPMSGNDGTFQWGSWQDIWNSIGIRPCLFKEGEVNYYLDPSNFAKREDGVTDSDITSGEDGDVMIEFPKIYWKMERVGDYLDVKYSTGAQEGFQCLAHTRNDGEGSVRVRDKVYMSAYGGYVDANDKLRSLSGKILTASFTHPTGTTYAQNNNGVGYEGYEMFPFYGQLMLQVLYTVWFKSLDSQTALGRGLVDASAKVNSGGTNNKGMFYGSTSGTEQIKFCGVEDLWGNLLWWVDGLYSNSARKLWIATDKFEVAPYDNPDSPTDKSPRPDNWFEHGTGFASNLAGYITDVHGDTTTGFVMTQGGGSLSTYYCDYGDLGTSRLGYFGGGWSFGSNAGVFYLFVNDSGAFAFSYIGSRSWFCQK